MASEDSCWLCCQTLMLRVWAMYQPARLKGRQHCTQVLGDEPEYSSCHGRVIATLDYIWYSERAYVPGASAARPSRSDAGSLSSINGWRTLRSSASPMDSIKESSSSAATEGLHSPAWSSTGKDSSASARGLGRSADSSEGRSSLKSAGSSQAGALPGRLSELNGDSQASRGTASLLFFDSFEKQSTCL